MSIVEIARALGSISPYAALVVLGIFAINRYFESQMKKQNGSALYVPGSVGALMPEVLMQKIKEIIEAEREAAWLALAMRRNEEIHRIGSELLRQYFGAESLYLDNQRKMLSLLEQVIKEIGKLRYTGRMRGGKDDSP